MQKLALQWRQQGKSVGFVPTMGALHDGHLSLICKAHQKNDITVVSVFVNPLQFGPKEDFNKYPRTLLQDKKLCEQSGCDVLFIPSVDDFYGDDFQTTVTAGALGELLEGASRPGHFDGVCTVVLKLLQQTLPTVLYLGQKDYQQACILKQMVSDLNLPLKVQVLPIVREKDGLAMSSRNRYLSSHQREQALLLHKTLKEMRRRLVLGERQAAVLKRRTKAQISATQGIQLDYVECLDASSMAPLKRLKGAVVILIAAKVGKTRLIDNIRLNVP